MRVDARATLGEGPSWDEANRLLYWVDIEGKKVFVYNPAVNENKTIEMDQMVGAIVPRSGNEAVIAMEKGLQFMNTKTGELHPISDPESDIQENRFNDGKCDPEGRFWAGTMSFDAKEGNGSLYCLETDQNITKKIGNVTISNGLAWSPDNRYMYYIDTPTRKVDRYEYDLETGDINNPVTVVEIPEGQGNPDGMTIDAEGNLWIAHWGGARISVWNPENGELQKIIPVPALNVTSCVFGGDELNELYITTASTGMTEEDLRKYPHAGGLFKLKTTVKGSPTYSYKG
nr:SMP-30/gluconolactonase/LRE family protein [Thalassobacillus pellis]